MMQTRFVFVLSMGVMAFANLTPAADLEKDPVIARMKKDIFFLAGEECEGRGTETKGILIAGDYIADTFKQAGLKPAGTDGYFQPFTIAGSSKLGTPNTLTLNGPDDAKLELKYGTDFTPTGLSATGKKSAELVFVGYGITAEKPKFDEYADLDVSGKFVVLLRKTPLADAKDNPFEKDAPTAAALASKIALAVDKKAAGILFVNDATYGKDGDSLMDFRYAGGQAASVPVLHIKRKVLDTILASQEKTLADIEAAINKDLKPQPVALKGWTADTEVTISKGLIPTRNVVAVSEGHGPLADETVVIGAHYDHLGFGEPGSLMGAAGKGKLHYGADDNGSGTTGLLEMARRFGAVKERQGRRVVFIAFAGEERGLFGSIHYCKEPTYPLTKTVFMLNMDMIGRVISVDDDTTTPMGSVAGASATASQAKTTVKRDRVVVYGTGTAEGMDTIVTDANKYFDFKIIKVPGGSGPSDHDSFYRKKIPVLFMFTGTHRDYHRPTDTPDKVNLVGLNKVVGFSEMCLNYFATQPSKPKYLVTKGGWEDPTEDRPARSSSRPSMPKLGIMPGNYESTEGGVLVEDVTPGGAAEKAGVMPKDVVIEIAGKPVKDINAYMTIMASQKAGTEIDIVVVRKAKKVTVKVTPLP